MFVLSMLDYCNALLSGSPNHFFKKFKTMLLSSSTSLPNSVMSHLFSIPYTGSQLKKKDWFQLASLCFKSLNGSAPAYLSGLLHLYSPSRQLHSSADTQVFRITSFHTKSSDQRSFSYQVPTTWNKLPASIHHACSVSSFKSSLKTFLFWKTFSSAPLPWDACMCQDVCGCVCLSESVCMSLLSVYLKFWHPDISTC